MANVWFCYEGDTPTLGNPMATIPLAECVERLGLSKAQFIGGPSVKVRFGDPNDGLGRIRGYEHVVVAIEEVEAKEAGWKAGYYEVLLTPDEAYRRLGMAHP